MSADPQIVTHLNAVLKNKLTGINQYFLHARILKHAGNLMLADHEYKASIGAMKHSDMLVEHILTLGGTPAIAELGSLHIGATTPEILANDLSLTEAAYAQVKDAISFCESKKSAASVALLGKILESQQEHADFIRTQLASNPNHKDSA
jgi:bacterioferritin